MPFSATKISVSGNKFVILDTRYQELSVYPEIQKQGMLVSESIVNNLKDYSVTNRKNVLEKLQGKLSVKEKFDGLCIIKPSDSYDFTCDFFNRDGSKASFCGNVTCGLAFYEEKLNHKTKLHFKFVEEEVHSFKNQNQFWIRFRECDRSVKKTKKIQGKEVSYRLVEAGVPHSVLKLDATPNPDKLRDLARELRKEQNANVSFFKFHDRNFVEALTYERGVEDFTLACATGALSIACFLRDEGLYNTGAFPVKMLGGELRVQLKPFPSFSSNPQMGY